MPAVRLRDDIGSFGANCPAKQPVVPWPWYPLLVPKAALIGLHLGGLEFTETLCGVQCLSVHSLLGRGEESKRLPPGKCSAS